MESIFENIFKKVDIITESDTSDNIIVIEEDIKEDIKENIKKYDSKKYNKTFYEKNKSKITEKIICNICMGSYTYFNKSVHNKSIRHIRCLNKPI